MDVTGNREYLTPRELSEKYPTFKPSWLRQRIWSRKKNGLDVAVRKIGKRIWIHEAKFFEWVESHRDNVEGDE